jgi:hypothetical protein
VLRLKGLEATGVGGGGGGGVVEQKSCKQFVCVQIEHVSSGYRRSFLTFL